VRLADCLYCAECREAQEVKSPYTERELDMHIEVMEERLQGGTKWRDRIREKGTHTCGLCGRPALPGRLYCSPRCRGTAPRVGGVQFELDGIKASFLGHARRRGIKDKTVLLRVARGMDPIKALTTPLLKKKHSGIGSKVFIVDGIEATFLEHVRRLGMNTSTAFVRVSRAGMDPVEALKTPVAPPSIGRTVFVVDGVEATFYDHVRRLKLNMSTVRARVARGMNPIDALKKPIKKKRRRSSPPP